MANGDWSCSQHMTLTILVYVWIMAEKCPRWVFDVNSSKIILGGTGSIKETYGKKIDMWCGCTPK
jgi:hypothetical protein